MNYFEEKSFQVEPTVLKAFGIEIESRYGKSHELIEMLTFCEKLANNDLSGIKKIFYDSKECICTFEFEFSFLSDNEEKLMIKLAKESITQFFWRDSEVYFKSDDE